MKKILIYSIIYVFFCSFVEAMYQDKSLFENKSCFGQYFAEFVYSLDDQQKDKLDLVMLLKNPSEYIHFPTNTTKQKESLLKLIAQHVKNSTLNAMHVKLTESVVFTSAGISLEELEKSAYNLHKTIEKSTQNDSLGDDEWCVLPSMSSYILRSTQEKSDTLRASYKNTWWNPFFYISSYVASWKNHSWDPRKSHDLSIKYAWQLALGDFYAHLTVEQFWFILDFIAIFKGYKAIGARKDPYAGSIAKFILTLSSKQQAFLLALCYCSLELLCFDCFSKDPTFKYKTSRAFHDDFSDNFVTYHHCRWPQEDKRLDDIHCIAQITAIAHSTKFEDMFAKKHELHISMSIRA